MSFGKVKVTFSIKGLEKQYAEKQIEKITKNLRKYIGLHVDFLQHQIVMACPKYSLKEAFYTSSYLTENGQCWFIGVKDLPPNTGKPNEYNTYQKVMALEYGRAEVPRSGKAPLYSAMKTETGEIERYMGTKARQSPTAIKLRDATPSIIIRVGPFEAVPPTYFIRNALGTWEPVFKSNIKKEIRSITSQK